MLCQEYVSGTRTPNNVNCGKFISFSFRTNIHLLSVITVDLVIVNTFSRNDRNGTMWLACIRQRSSVWSNRPMWRMKLRSIVYWKCPAPNMYDRPEMMPTKRTMVCAIKMWVMCMSLSHYFSLFLAIFVSRFYDIIDWMPSHIDWAFHFNLCATARNVLVVICDEMDQQQQHHHRQRHHRHHHRHYSTQRFDWLPIVRVLVLVSSTLL